MKIKKIYETESNLKNKLVLGALNKNNKNFFCFNNNSYLMIIKEWR